ncbi:MipA/OmpV family protein [Alteromonas oceanisediminis]|uniref:MipA/OmpV family protein n=1 Tax=Alteromonas oceanisediminis TaxID=2836180 RepID=UPI001BD97AC3|nr:MipA/OmpV family protein [Alteromonas oceanisediminis]MBT0586781.1 MipA/OmpV family protein [Alteromonas oceanisediminis]
MPVKTIVYLTMLLACLCASSDVVANTAESTPEESPDRSLTGFEALDEAQPLWEFGVGGGFIEVPNYPASSERNSIALASPYVVYRGDVFRVGGGNGARAVVLEDSDFELDLSFGGAFAADTDDNSARAGMPELDFLFEIGSQLIYRVKDFRFADGGNGRLNARLQTIAVFSTDFSSLDDRGFLVEPALTYQQRGVLFKDTGLNVSLSAIFATERLHDYFYQVDEPFVTATRPAYDAQSGYLGTEVSVGVSFPIHPKIRGFVGGSVQFHQGSANESSPLFEEEITYSVGLGFVWRLYQSSEKATW